MKHLFVCPMDDTLKITSVDLRGDEPLYGAVTFQTYTPPEPSLYPYVASYFQQYNAQRKPLRQFLREHTGSARPRDCLLALHDDATDLEAYALSELMIACGVRETLLEYRAFLLSGEPEYIAVTGSKRAVTLTHVISDTDDTERIFLPVNEAVPETVRDAIRELDAGRKLPAFSFGLPDALMNIGETVTPQELLRNFLRIL